MASLFNGIANAIAYYVVSPKFEVSIDTSDTDGCAIAGQLTTICTISIKFPDNYWLKDPREEVSSLRPDILLISRNSWCRYRLADRTEHSEDHWVSDKEVRFDIFLRKTKADIYDAVLKFYRNVNFVGPNTVRLNVKAAKPRYINLIGKEVKQGHGQGDSVYRGGEVKFFLKIEDEYRNACEENDFSFTCNLSQPRRSVTLISTEFDNSRREHVVTIRCDQSGVASFGLSLQAASLSGLQVTITPPPVCASLSYVPNRDEIKNIVHVAGVPFKVNLVLVDVLGNVVPYEEREEIVKQLECEISDTVPIKTKLGQNSNKCELEIAPIAAGHHRMSLSIANKRVKNFPIQMTIVPGPLAVIRIVHHNPLHKGNDIISSYPTEQRAVVVEGTDEHGNVVPLDPQAWYLEISGEPLQNPIIVDGTHVDSIRTLKFNYTFERKATYNLTIMQSMDASRTNVEVPSFEIQVTRPPIDFERCQLKVCQEEPIFTGAFRCLQLQLLLYDRTNEEYEITPDEIPHLQVKVNSEVCHHVVRLGTEPNELILVLDQIEESGEKDIHVMYKDEEFRGLDAFVDGVIPYDEEEYIEQDEHLYQLIRCVGVSRRFVIGEDCANINNIQRVLDNHNYTHPDLLDTIDREAINCEVVFDLKMLSPKVFSEVIRLLSLLIKGAHHYRDQAKEFDGEREEWKEKATIEYHRGNHQKAKKYKEIKEKFGQLMNESNRLASDAIFEFFNDGRHESEIDLHGQLVADEELLEDYKRQLLRKGNRTRREVEAIVERERKEGDEAIRLVRERLQTLRNREQRPRERDWLEIIDGAGHHSRGGQKIRPKVRRFLDEKGYEYIEANKGALLITFSEYTGDQPCYGNFYCIQCEKAWVSHACWKTYYHKCYRCDKNGRESRCYPFKLRSASPSRRPRRRDRKSSLVFTDEDHIRLCQKCQEHGPGVDCRNVSSRLSHEPR